MSINFFPSWTRHGMNQHKKRHHQYLCSSNYYIIVRSSNGIFQIKVTYSMIFNFLDNRHIKKYCQSSSFNYHPLSLISCALTFTETKYIINVIIRKGEKNQTNHFKKTSYFHLLFASSINILNIANI